MNANKFFEFFLGAEKGLAVKFALTTALVFGLATFATDAKAEQSDNIITELGEDEVLAVAETMPQFPGGNAALHDFLTRNVRYPAQAEGATGRVYVQFVVGADGSVSNVHVARPCNPALDKEALRVVGKMPAWTPGTVKGHNVNVVYTVPISFKVQ